MVNAQPLELWTASITGLRFWTIWASISRGPLVLIRRFELYVHPALQSEADAHTDRADHDSAWPYRSAPML
jgi:hypothetical protein